MKIDILAFGAHPDDIELGSAGTIAKLVEANKKVCFVDLTKGEMGTRGNIETRRKEANESANLLGVEFREQLNLGDAKIENNIAHQNEVIRMIRKYRPEVVLANALVDRHIDHGRAARLVADSCFLSGLAKWETKDESNNQEAWRPKVILHYIQDQFLKPTLVVDITKHFETKMLAITTFKSQFYDPESKENETPISSQDFLKFLESRAREMGRSVGVSFGEGFICEVPVDLRILSKLFPV